MPSPVCINFLQRLKSTSPQVLDYKLECQQYAADEEAKAQRLRQDQEARRQKEENTRLQDQLAIMGLQLNNLSSTIDSLQWQEC